MVANQLHGRCTKLELLGVYSVGFHVAEEATSIWSIFNLKIQGRGGEGQLVGNGVGGQHIQHAMPILVWSPINFLDATHPLHYTGGKRGLELERKSETNGQSRH